MLIPYWVISSRGVGTLAHGNAFRYFGIPLILIGAAGLLLCIWKFFSEGRGTLAPVDPPKQLVVRGLYRYVRNPMYVSVMTILIGETICFMSTAIMIEAVIFMALVHLFIVFYEEPTLRRETHSLPTMRLDSRAHAYAEFHGHRCRICSSDKEGCYVSLPIEGRRRLDR